MKLIFLKKNCAYQNYKILIMTIDVFDNIIHII